MNYQFTNIKSLNYNAIVTSSVFRYLKNPFYHLSKTKSFLKFCKLMKLLLIFHVT